MEKDRKKEGRKEIKQRMNDKEIEKEAKIRIFELIR